MELLFSADNLKHLVQRSLENGFEECSQTSEGKNTLILKDANGSKVKIRVSKDRFHVNASTSKKVLFYWVGLAIIIIQGMNIFSERIPPVLSFISVFAIIICIVAVVSNLTKSNTQSEGLAKRVKDHLEKTVLI